MLYQIQIKDAVEEYLERCKKISAFYKLPEEKYELLWLKLRKTFEKNLLSKKLGKKLFKS